MDAAKTQLICQKGYGTNSGYEFFNNLSATGKGPAT